MRRLPGDRCARCQSCEFLACPGFDIPLGGNASGAAASQRIPTQWKRVDNRWIRGLCAGAAAVHELPIGAAAAAESRTAPKVPFWPFGAAALPLVLAIRGPGNTAENPGQRDLDGGRGAVAADGPMVCFSVAYIGLNIPAADSSGHCACTNECRSAAAAAVAKTRHDRFCCARCCFATFLQQPRAIVNVVFMFAWRPRLRTSECADRLGSCSVFVLILTCKCLPFCSQSEYTGATTGVQCSVGTRCNLGPGFSLAESICISLHSFFSRFFDPV